MASGPSEFGGGPMVNNVQPSVTPRGHKGHTDLTNGEMLHLVYVTGQNADQNVLDDGGLAFSGLLPIEKARELNPDPEKFPLE